MYSEKEIYIILNHLKETEAALIANHHEKEAQIVARHISKLSTPEVHRNASLSSDPALFFLNLFLKDLV